MFSHGPMSGSGGPKVLLGTYSHTLKVQIGAGGHGPVAPLDPLLNN